MRFESLNADLKRWLQASIEAGHDREVLQRAMRTSGYDSGFARGAVEAALTRLQGQAAVVPTKPGAQPFAGAANTVAASDRTVDILMTLASPRVVLLGNLLSGEECEQMIEAARRKLARSTVVNAATGAYDVHPDRTSSGTHFERGETELVSRIEQRISELIDCPAENGEPLQVLHYTPGAEYKPHYDYFDPAQPGTAAVLKRGGQRVGTLVMYLHVPKNGGGTVFPDVGLEVAPVKGHALFFSYDRPHESTGTLHGGSPVTDGEKWVATKWMREGVFG